jgi:hypothetical protein
MFIVWYLIKHRNNFTFYLLLGLFVPYILLKFLFVDYMNRNSRYLQEYEYVHVCQSV